MTHMILSQTVKDGLLAAVREAGKTEIMPRFRNLPEGSIESKAHADDLVTIADKRSELLIAERAAKLLPSALIIGEEAVADDPALLGKMADADVSVVIDPIDGTSAFVSGLATFGVLLAVRVNGQTEYGLLYDPIMDDWVVAERGHGTQFVNAAGKSRVLRVPAVKPMDQMQGYVPLYLFPKDKQPVIAQAYPKFKRITTLRCSCHEYRMMATGHSDFTLNPMSKPWDHMAGILALEECGGRVETHDGLPYDPTAPKGPLWAFAFEDRATQDKIKASFLG